MTASYRMCGGLIVVALFVAEARAQLPNGGWVVGNGLRWVIYFSENFSPIENPGFWGSWGSIGGDVAVDGGRMVYITEQLGAVYRVSYDPLLPSASRLVVETPGCTSTPLVDPLAPHLTVTRDSLWYAERTGNLWSLDKAVNGQTPVPHGSIWNLNPSLYGKIQSICTDGRELFFATGLFTLLTGTGLAQSDIWAVDLRALTNPRRHVASFPLDRPTRLCLGPDGDILAMRTDGLYRITPSTGAVAFVCARPTPPTFSPLGVDRILVAYDPWLGKVAVGPQGTTDLTHIEWKHLATNPPWSTAWYFSFHATLIKLSSASEQPFELFGIGCPNALGKDPRMGWQGLPRQGQAFALNLRDAEPNGLAMIWLGWSNTFWAPVGALPFDAGPLGAPGCSLLVAPDGPLPFLVDPNGRAAYSINVPVNPAIAGMRVFAQSVSSTGANSLGFAASDALEIRLR